jgi:purine nucleosidase
MPRKIIIDCDPGHDAMAILLAHGNPETGLCAITTIAGNQTLEKITMNAPHLHHRQHHRCARGPRFADPTTPLADIHAVDLITLVPIGPLTNIAVALRQEP